MTLIHDHAGNAFGTLNPLATQGQTAHDGVVTGFPFRIAGKAVTAITATATGDAHDVITTLHGSQIVKLYAIPEYDWQFAVAAPIAVSTDVVVKAAGAAGIRNYVTGFQLINTNAVPTEIVLKDGATVIWRGFLPANMTSMVDYTFTTPLKGTAVTAVNFQCVTAGASVYLNVQGYIAP